MYCSNVVGTPATAKHCALLIGVEYFSPFYVFAVQRFVLVNQLSGCFLLQFGYGFSSVLEIFYDPA